MVMGIRTLIGSVVTQIIVTGLLLGIARRVGVVTVHPKALKTPTARKALEVFVSTGDYVVQQTEQLVRNSVKALN